MKLFLCGDVMTGRGIDQILPHPSDPHLFESCARDAREYVALAEACHGAIAKPVKPSYIWGDALSALEREPVDVRLVNLETSVTTIDDYWRGKGVNYRMHPANIGCLTAARIDVCALANNHVLDYGYAGLAETVQTLKGAGIHSVGAGRTLAEAHAPARLSTSEGIHLVVVACGVESSGIPREWGACHDRAGIDFLSDLSRATADRIVACARQTVANRDVVVVSIHWGGNWGYEVPRSHVQFAHWLIDGGAHIVHGHSSHHPRPIERYRNGLILYGCGDFINDYEGIEGSETYRPDLTLAYLVTVADCGDVTRVELQPFRIRKMQLIDADAADAAWLQETLNRVSAPFRTHVELESKRTLAVRAA